MTGSEAAENEVGDSRQYSVSNLDNDESYDLFLFPSENVTMDSDGVVSFSDVDGTNQAGNNKADWSATDADITVVNGTTTGDTNGTVVDVSPVNGTINFTINSTTPNESVIPVLLVAEAASNDANPDLDLNAANEPTEDFGIGGEKSWVPEEAATGALGVTDDTEDQEIVSVNKDTNRIVTDVATYFYDASDRFFVDAGENPCGNLANEVTMADFEASLTAGDELDYRTFYNANEALQSTFCLENLEPAQPTATASEITDDALEVTVTNRRPGASVTLYVVAAGDDCDDSALASNTSSTDEDASTAGFQISVSGLNDATAYQYCVFQTVDGEDSPVAGPTAFTTQPTGFDADLLSENAVVTNSTLIGVANTGDVWEIGYNLPIDATAAATAQLQVVDGQGDTAVVDCAGATACTVNAEARTFEGHVYQPGELLRIQLGAALVDGTDALNYPLEVTASIRIYEAGDATNTWDLADSPDTTLEVDEAAASEDDIAPAMASAVADTGVNTVTVTYTEAVQCATAAGTYGQFAYDGATAAPTGITCSGSTATITFIDVTGAGDLVYTQSTTEADRVEDLNNNDAVSPQTVAATA